MRSAEVTILHLITSNFNHGAEKGPHKEFVYTPFQEGARRNFMGTLANSLKRLGWGNKSSKHFCWNCR